MTNLAGKRALVTGGGSGAGAEIALQLAGAGCDVVVSGRGIAALEAVAAQSDRITAHVCDVTDEASVAVLFKAAGPFDIAVANAGITESAPFHRTELEAFERVMAVNVTGVFLTFREALQDMRGKGWGRLIAIASIAGLHGGAYIAPYCASKHGVVGMVRALAKETAKAGITVNAVCPGYLDTPMTDRTLANIVEKTGKSSEEALAVVTANNPMGRLIAPSEVAASVLWLCGEGSESISGQALAISGGEI